MSEWQEFTAKTVDEALTNAVVSMQTSSDQLEYEVIEEGSSRLLGLISKPAKIRARVKLSLDAIAFNFLDKVFQSMGMQVNIEITIDEVENQMNIDLSGEEMGILIGKRGITLDSLQYLVSLVINRNTEDYMKVKLDTENYRERRKETLENLAHNLAHKVKRIHRPVYLEPMNPYERRVIHTEIQEIEGVKSHSIGSDSDRRVVISLEEGVKPTHGGNQNRGRGGYHNNRGGRGRDIKGPKRDFNNHSSREKNQPSPSRAPHRDVGAAPLYGKIEPKSE